MKRVMAIHKEGAVFFCWLDDDGKHMYSKRNYGTTIAHAENYTITEIPAFPGEKATTRLYGGIYLLVGFPPVYGDKAVAALRAENGNYVEFYIEDIYPIEPTYDVTVKGLTRAELTSISGPCAYTTNPSGCAAKKFDSACASKLKEIDK